MAQVCLGAFRSRSPEVGVAGRRGCCYWRGATAIRTFRRSLRLDFSRINRRYNPKFEISIRRPLMVSGDKAARAARRPELEALGG
jgi:hypothetical protein